MSKKVKLSRCMVVLSTAVVLSGIAVSSSVFASDNTHAADVTETGEADTADAPAMYTDDEIPPEMEAFYEQMMSGNELKAGEERVLWTWNGGQLSVKAGDVIEGEELP